MTDEDRRLRRAFLKSLAESTPLPEDPPLEQVWLAARGDLTQKETLEVLDRVAASPACAEAWMIARRFLEAERGSKEFPPSKGNDRPSWLRRPFIAWKPVAVAAGVILTVMAVVFWPRSPGEPIYRGDPGTREPHTPAGAELARADAVLRWSQGPPGTLYRLRVYRADFSPVVVVEDLTEPYFRIPEERLQDVRDGEELQWQVESIVPDGGRTLSQPVVVRITSRGGAGAGQVPGP